MTVIGRSNHAFFFDGVSDSIIIPEGQFTALGHKTLDGTSDVRNILSESPHGGKLLTASGGDFSKFPVIEAWIMPDCGGTVIEKEGQFKLSVGNVDTPGPTIFEVSLQDNASIQHYTLTTATLQSNRYEGTVYPYSSFGGIHDSYNRFTGNTYDDATDLNRNHRQLLHVVAAVRPSTIELYVNGTLMAEKDIQSTDFSLVKSNASVYVGGKGGQFRGVIEAVHLNGALNSSHINGNSPLPDNNTQLLYRFEEPIAPIEGVYTMNNPIDSSITYIYPPSEGGEQVSISQIAIPVTEAVALAKKLTGLSTVTGIYDFTASPYSNGDYRIVQSTSSGATIRKIPHVPYNILINPGSINPNTKIPNQTAPERLRLHNINVSNGTCLVSSIHLDYGSSTSGIRGVLHTSRTTDVDNHFVVIGADLLIDSGTGKPYQPPHFSSQMVDRTGQMVIDEGPTEQHGFVYSSRMATTTSDPNNPFAVIWPTTLDESFQIGHSGRHSLNHVDGHAFLRTLPRANEEIIDQRVDGSADIIDIIYDEMQQGVEEQVSINSRVDVFREAGNFELKDVVNSSTVKVAFNSYNGTNSPPTGELKLIAIGGPDFDFTPFMLKGPVPAWKGTFDDNTRNFHLRPSKESRIALLHVPQLTSTNVKFAPYVEIHYNAIDLTGASMSGTAQPLLMVEKTVPASDVSTGAGSFIYDAIITSLASGKTLYAPGGYIDINTSDSILQNNVLSPHSLVGDVSEGYSADDELDDSLTPVNYTPRADADSKQNSPPKIITESVSTTGLHESAFNKLTLNKLDQKLPLADKGLYSRVEPKTVVESPSTGQFDTGVTSSSSPIHEIFDIVDNIEIIDSSSADMRLIIQPSDRRRTNQLFSVNSLLSSSDDANTFSLMYLMSRARVRSIEENEGEDGTYTTIRCIGLSEAANSRGINFTGRGSPDSHVVKEIEPNSPVVTVTLGGPGQGAMDTRPTNQPSILAHEPYSSRRAFATTAYKLNMNWSSGAGTLYVKPLNNESTDLASWGTYGFPRYGRIYLPDGSSAKYDTKTGETFVFSLATVGSGDYLSSDGIEYTTVGQLLSATGFLKGVTSGDDVDLLGNFTVYNEPDFGEQSKIENGSTVNDRMFQSMDDVSHDYQLGTQYASTRALTEIPFFSKQFFDTGVGPDNGFKVHIDATHTAHTYNPSPVGRRLKDTPPADREVQSAYSLALANREYINSTFIHKYDATNNRLHVNDISIFPSSSTSVDTYKGVKKTYRYRKVWLADGEWCWYTDTSSGYLVLFDATYGHSSGFFDNLEPGTAVFIGGALLDTLAKPLASDTSTPSSDFEDRGEYYHDAASVKTQGGNVDYGLRQYASAVEFKAGPESNPHAEKIQSGRASAIVKTSTLVDISQGTSNTNKALVLTFSDEDFKHFPKLDYDVLGDAPTDTGSLRYELQYDADGTLHRYQYHGHIKYLTGASITTNPENSITVVYDTLQASSPPSALEGKRVTLARRCREVVTSLIGGPTMSLAGTMSYNEVRSNLKLNTNAVITAQAAAQTDVRVTNATEKLSLSDLHGLNVKKGDTIFYVVGDFGGEMKKIGTVTSVGEPLSPSNPYTQAIQVSTTTPQIPANAKLAVLIGDFEDKDAILNTSWLNPYAPGGLRNGDTVWANMTYNNPHAVEGLFAKSRGVLNEAQVWNGFDGGKGELDNSPRDSIPLENFLIGNTCLETARNYAQHVNRTVEENYLALGLTASQAPTVAYVDPYLAEDGHARVLLYDTAHDREFVAFQDLHMQVQSSAQAPELGWPKEVVESGADERTRLDKLTATYNGSGPSPWTTQIDVTNGFPSQNPYIRSTQQSKFIESAYAHDLANRHTEDLLDSGTHVSISLPDDGRKILGSRLYGKAHGHHVHTGYSIGGTITGLRIDYSVPPRTDDSVVLHKVADGLHSLSRVPGDTVDKFTSSLISLRTGTAACSFRDPSTFFDTPDGTRVIPAFLCLKGIRSSTLDLSSHEEGRLQHLPQWKDMDFVRRLTIDTGVVAQKDGVVNTEAAAQEIVRLINQHAALNARFTDGSAHDPAPFWDKDSKDRGTHMGYIRAHVGREVQDLNGDTGHTVVIHSTVPGASGRNFCVWLDNSTGQSPYQPQFLIGHGGRWRNFWALPEENEGENMHPAPMPLNKHGRPFAPITTLQQYIRADESGEEVRSVAEFENDNVLRAVSDTVSGKNHNTVNDESFALKGSSSTLVKGLRVGKRAVSRINFGGLVASGVPGWAPDAGTWGFGKKGDSRFDTRYGSFLTSTTNTTAPSSYTSHVPTANVLSDVVGSGQLYGFRFKDNIGSESGLRFIYRKMGDSFANENTTLPSTIEDEVCVFFDDRDVGQGGFTIGKHMHGTGDATGRLDIEVAGVTETDSNWKGARWRGVSAPNVAVHVSTSISGDTLTVTFDKGPFRVADALLEDRSGTTVGDTAGYLGFPKKNGIMQITDFAATADVGQTISYTRRDIVVGTSGGGSSGPIHKFYGCTGLPALGSESLISPTLNWTTLVTDELIAAATAAAINAGKEVNTEEGHTFDCTEMYATDGRTFGEWGVGKKAIRIRVYDPQSPVTPLNESYSAHLLQDFGIQAAHLEFGEIRISEKDNFGWQFHTSRAIIDDNIDGSRSIDCGYIPFNVLEIISTARGPHTNTPSPNLVDSRNTIVDTNVWREGLKGVQFTRSCGDHILPMIDNPQIFYAGGLSNWATQITVSDDIGGFLIPAGITTATSGAILPIGERKKIWLNDKHSIQAESKVGASSERILKWVTTDADSFPSAPSDTNLLQHHVKKEFDGLRSIGSVFSEPITYFRGGKRSSDHSVPLYFGGGFSGVTLDVNDGTSNDYSSFYTHPYANGPTGTAGIQNANEISTSFALMDCNAMFAFFPGAALCNQHRGSINPPAFNRDNVLSPDLKKETVTMSTTAYTNGEVIAKPVPLVLRFAHPTARYEDHRNGTDSKTTYLVFGPGQAFPFTREVLNDGANPNVNEPYPGRVIQTGNSWAAVPSADTNDMFPNSIRNSSGNYLPLKQTEYLLTAGFHWRAMTNWETPAGYCWKGSREVNIPLHGIHQRPEHGRHYGQMLNDATIHDADDFQRIQPKMHTPLIGFGITMGADTVWHMDGGFHPGGSWLDDQITFNPVHPKKNTRITGGNSSTTWTRDNQIHPTAFRVAGPMMGGLQDYLDSDTDFSIGNTKMEYVVIDATRCQNGEELATVMGSAINAFPGAGALKAMGGTHMPSMGNAMRQDRYGWVDLGNVGATTLGSSSHPRYVESAVNASQTFLEQVPASGWLRVADTDTTDGDTVDPGWAVYHSRDVIASGGDWKIRFFLAPNRIRGNETFEWGDTWANHQSDNDTWPENLDTTDKMYVWAKAGTIRFNNEDASTRDHMTQVHFSGLADAIDRTRPVGVVGWHGERYSYLNSLKITKITSGTGYAAGLGAWHQMLGFSPYGSAGSIMNTYGTVPVVAPMQHSPESTPTIDGMTNDLDTYITKATLYDDYNLEANDRTYTWNDTDSTGNANQYAVPTNYYTTALPEELTLPQGLYSNAFLVVSYESESALVAKFDRDGITATGDWLHVFGEGSSPITFAGTTLWDERFHDEDRFIAPANAGPNVEALIVDDTAVPTFASSQSASTDNWSDSVGSVFHPNITDDMDLKNATPGLNKTGDLVFDLDHSVGSVLLESADAERNVSADKYDGTQGSGSIDYTATTGNSVAYPRTHWMGDVHAFEMYKNSAAKNFSIENVVWKRMDGGNLSLPTINARGLGAVPWVTRVKNNTAYTTGEKLYGNVRFSFETTNSAMLPVLQAQELAHPELMRKHPYKIGNVLNIPNEEVQFQSITVTDETGQVHKIEGGSPLGTIIRGFRTPENRGVKGNAPSLANSGKTPNLKVQLPNPDSIPGNIVVRSGFDPLQAYQNETMGSGGMIHPDLGAETIGHLFDNSVVGPRKGPTYEDHNWERIDPVTFDSEVGQWNDNSPLETSYELHDRTLFFHVCKMGHSHTHRYPTVYNHAAGLVTNVLTASSWDSATSILTTNTVDRDVYAAGADATATITITAFTELNAGDKVNLVATDGTNYDFTNGDQSSVNGTFEGTTSNDVTATNLMNVINTSSGPSGTRFSATVNGATVTVTQAVKGVDGNTTVTLTDSGTAGMTKTDFIDGGRHRFGSKEVKDGRGFIRIYNPSTEESVVASYTGISGQTFTGVVGDVDFTAFMAAQTITDLKVVPSYYVPGGSTRFFAARRLRDHAEVSGNSPDMAHTRYFAGDTVCYNAYNKPVMTPMPYPRMGHHFVTPTMPMLPGHWAHPAYQSLYKRHLSDYNTSVGFVDSGLFSDYTTPTRKKVDIETALTADAGQTTILEDRIKPMDAEINFSAINAAPSGPSDIHGGAFTLMFETGLRYDGYGILASTDKDATNGSATALAGTVNKAGGHSIVFEAAANYTLGRHFPDPAEVGAYQIVIQPNLFNNQLVGFHNNSTAELTSQQINTVIAINDDATKGGLTLVLAKATQADVRGCEVFINEAILDVSPDFGSQFTNIPPLMLHNAHGIQMTESPTFTRRGFPYSTMFNDSSPGHTLNIPWWSILHKYGALAGNATDFRKLTQYSPDDYYMFSRSGFGSVGSQLTLNGYSSTYIDIYSKLGQIASLNPKCTVVEDPPYSVNGSTGVITVDNASLFPMNPHYAQVIEYTAKNGEKYSLAYTKRAGGDAADVNLPNTITLPGTNTSAAFWSNMYNGAVLRLSHSYNTLPPGDLLTNKSKSVFANILPDIVHGNQDTHSLHIPDAFLCMWHPNLGRPNTYFSDSRTTWGSNAVVKDSYNSLPEHFETIHYHDFSHTMSMGPFEFLVKTPNVTKTGQVIAGDTNHDAGGKNAMLGGFWPCGSRGGPHVSKLDLYSMAATSWSLQENGHYANYSSNSPRIWEDEDDDGSYSVSGGIRIASQSSGVLINHPLSPTYYSPPESGAMQVDGVDATTVFNVGDSLYGGGAASGDSAGIITAVTSTTITVGAGISIQLSNNMNLQYASTPTRRPYGYRNAVRQAYNKPTYGLNPTRAIYEPNPTGSGIKTLDYDAGPLVQTEVYTSSWNYAGGSGGVSAANHPVTYVGIMERQTNFTGMLAQDQADWQVRYSDGRRMTRPFGTPVRTLTNNAGTRRDWWGDEEAMDKSSLSEASQYYLVDWWGNERGEAVRRAPVRGIGIRPAWDCADVYENDRTNSRNAHRRVWNNGKPIFNVKGIMHLTTGNVDVDDGYSIPRFGGTDNDENLISNNNDLVDIFAPTHSLRVGDMGNGRGVRYPTQFNEDVLTELSAPIHKTGVVLSHNTAEPLFGNGLLRPRNAVLQADEMPRGISARLGISENGLLKPEAVVSDRTEEIIGVSPHKDAISRTSPRIGIDAEVTERVEQNHIAINTEAHSLHTDRNVGQRAVLHGAFQVGTNTISDVNHTGTNFGRQNAGSVTSTAYRFSHTNGFRPYGGSYVLETKSYGGLFDDTGWGVGTLTGANDTSNPYQNADEYDSKTVRNNEKDKSVKFLLRPVRVLDAKHVEVFRVHNSLHSSSPQYTQNYLFASSGGKYGLFSYEVGNGRTAVNNIATGRALPDGDGPYLPVFGFDSTGTFLTPSSTGPKLPGTEVSDFDKTSLASSVTRVVISDNTLQHHRSDAPRRRQEQDTDDELKRMDFSVKARFSQALHGKGHKEDVSFSITDHSGDGA